MVEELCLAALLGTQAVARAVLLAANTQADAGAAAEVVGRAGHVGTEEDLAGHLRAHQAIHTGLCKWHVARRIRHLAKMSACLIQRWNAKVSCASHTQARARTDAGTRDRMAGTSSPLRFRHEQAERAAFGLKTG